MFAFPKNALILFFKAQQHALFAAPVTVQGHTRANGVFVAPYVSRRKKRMVPSKTADLFGAGQLQHPARTVATAVQPPDPPDPPLPPAGNPVEPPKARPSLLTSPAPPGGSGGGKGSNGGNGGNGGEPPDKKREAQRQYDAVVARYTLPDGTKAPGWMKAPNGQPTKLNERQWVQVRTENFKQWFGDWETLAKEAHITPLSLPRWDGNIRELTALAREVYARQLQGKEILNLDTNERVRFTAEGKGEAFSGIKKPADAQVVKSLTRLVRRAIHVDSELPDARRMSDTKAFHTFVAPLQIENEIFVAKLIFREAARGPENLARWKFYDIAVFKDPLKQNARLGLGLDDMESALPSTAPLNSGHKISVGRLLEEFKGDNLRHVPVASKVIDANGEPLVVYHGTTAQDNFSVFDPEVDWVTDPGQFGKGFYFSASHGNGEVYAGTAGAYADGDNGRIIPAFLSIKNPDRITQAQWTPSSRAESVRQQRESKGYDGVWAEDIRGDGKKYGADEWVAFFPTQIKSALGNTGGFDGKDAHINKAGPFPPDVRFLFFAAKSPKGRRYAPTV